MVRAGSDQVATPGIGVRYYGSLCGHQWGLLMAAAGEIHMAAVNGRPGLLSSRSLPHIPANHVRGCTGSTTNIAAWTVNIQAGALYWTGLYGVGVVDCSVWFADHVCCAVAPLQLGFH